MAMCGQVQMNKWSGERLAFALSLLLLSSMEIDKAEFHLIGPAKGDGACKNKNIILILFNGIW